MFEMCGVPCQEGKSPNMHVIQVIGSQSVSLIFASENLAASNGSSIDFSFINFVVAPFLDGSSRSDQSRCRQLRNSAKSFKHDTIHVISRQLKMWK